jgi:hypothetical protein
VGAATVTRMTAPAAVTASAHAAARAESSPLQVFVACAPWVIALPTASVERLLLAEEAPLQSIVPTSEAPAHLGLLASGRVVYSAWDLGTLLDLSAQSEAWVLLRIPRPGGPLPIALRTGACLSTGPLPASSLAILPSTLASERPGVLSAAFQVPNAGRSHPGAAPVGLALELTRLWSEAELVAAEEALRARDTDAQ